MRRAILLLQEQCQPIEATLSRKHAVTPGSSHVFRVPYENMQAYIQYVKFKLLRIKLQEAQNQASYLIAPVHRSYVVYDSSNDSSDDPYILQE